MRSIALALVLLPPLLCLPGCDQRSPAATPQPAAAPGGPRQVDITVSNQGYAPGRIRARPGETLLMRFRYDPSAGECGREVMVKGERRTLSPDRPVELSVTMPADQKELVFTCGMNMLRGVIVLD